MAVKEVKPGIERRKVVIPHYDVGGVVSPGGGGLFGAIGGGLGDLAGDFTTQNKYNATLAPTTQNNYAPTIDQAGQNALAGYGTFQQNQNQQAELAAALRGVSNGTGPNPAQAMLNNSTGANVANQAALIAGQRGAGANVGLQARQAAMAGASAQQQAAGQAAALQSQQQLNALNAQGAVLGQMGSQNIAEQGANTGLFSASSGAQNAQNNTAVQNYGMAEGLNQKTSQNNADATNKTMGGMMNGIGQAAAMFGLAHGGQVPSHLQAMHSIYHADGGEIVPTSTATNTDSNTSQPPILSPEQMKSKEKALKDAMDLNSTSMVGFADGGMYAPKGYTRQSNQVIGNKNQAAIDNLRVQEGPVSGDDSGGTPNDWQMKRLAQDPHTAAPEGQLPNNIKPATQLPSSVIGASDYRDGGRVGGVAKVAGDSIKNDTQPAMLSPKEIVLPRSITMAPDAPEKARAFVEAILKKQGHGNSKHHKEFHKALKAAILSRKS